MRTIKFRSGVEIREDIHREIPRLINTGWLVNSPYDTEYKCIAWAACRTSRIWWPWDDPSCYWPSGFPKYPVGTPIPVNDFADMFATKFGYQVCGSDTYELGYQKVAIFANDAGVTHMARQCFLGKGWLSKLGKYEDIIHWNVRDVEGDMDPTTQEYGEVALYMKRSWFRACLTLCLFTNALASIRFSLYRLIIPWDLS